MRLTNWSTIYIRGWITGGAVTVCGMAARFLAGTLQCVTMICHIFPSLSLFLTHLCIALYRCLISGISGWYQQHLAFFAWRVPFPLRESCDCLRSPIWSSCWYSLDAASLQVMRRGQRERNQPFESITCFWMSENAIGWAVNALDVGARKSCSDSFVAGSSSWVLIPSWWSALLFITFKFQW